MHTDPVCDCCWSWTKDWPLGSLNGLIHFLRPSKWSNSAFSYILLRLSIVQLFHTDLISGEFPNFKDLNPLTVCSVKCNTQTRQLLTSADEFCRTVLWIFSFDNWFWWLAELSNFPAWHLISQIMWFLCMQWNFCAIYPHLRWHRLWLLCWRQWKKTCDSSWVQSIWDLICPWL